MDAANFLTNEPYFNREERTGGFQEVWYLKFNNVEAARALWLRFTVLIRNDKSKEVAEVWAIFFDANDGSVHKVGIKNTWPIASFENMETQGLRIEHNSLLPDRTEGSVSDDNHQLRWSLFLKPLNNLQFDFVPAMLPRFKLVKNTAATVYENLAFSGWCEVDGARYEWTNAPGMQGHLSGPRNGHSWAWGHCNCFSDPSGAYAPVVWDGLCARAPLGKGAAPPLTSMFFRIGDKTYHVNTMRDVLRSRSHYDFDQFTFRVKKCGVLFEGTVSARLEDYAGVTYEDTDGSLLYCHNSKISDMILSVTHANGATTEYKANRAVAYEVVSREAHPNVPLLI